MSLILISVAFAAVGAALGRWWTLWVPIALGASYVLFSTVTGSFAQQDNPIIFLAVIACVAMAAGVFARRQRSPMRQ